MRCDGHPRLKLDQDEVDQREHQGAHHRATQRQHAAEHQHGQGDERQVDVELACLHHSVGQGEEPTSHTRDDSGGREGDDALRDHVDP